ncbi:MAG: NAD(P)/FAD-dependent oxidoreductase [Solirubrobacterales bacterium]|nr:NAD(P)/FAD-dependent oxidoreductase [Solirubrobacterales bacterium]
MSEREFDVIVVGAGPSGEVAAGRLGDAGLEVAIVEREKLGGECSYWACMPSKALLRPAQALAEARRVPGAAQAATGTLDVAAVLARRDEIIHDLDDSGQEPWLEEHGVTLVRGHGSLVPPGRRVAVGDDVLVARRAVIVAVGSVAALPPIPGLAEAHPWTNREITTAKSVPARIAIIGGGVVGVEMSQAWSTLGAQVTLVQNAGRLIPREEPFASEQVLDGLRELGVDVRLGVRTTSVARDTGGQVTLELNHGDAITADELVVAAGRRPPTDELGLDCIGLEPGMNIEVDDHMCAVSHPWLYAIGDVNGRSLLTHMGKYQARIAADHVLGRGRAAYGGARGTLSPRVIFTEPQVAAVGHTLASAETAGLKVRSVDAPTSGNAGGSFYGRNAPGTTRIVVDEDRGVLVGATFTGADVSEFVHAATIAIVGEVPLDLLWHATPSFPTRSEVWLALLAGYGL